MGNDQRLNRAQRGAYAVEFALVFPVFFMVLYALLTYGLIFAAQQTLNYAAENAARSALQWQPGDHPQTFQSRMVFARDRAVAMTGWVDSLAGPGQVQIQICPRSAAAGTMTGVGGHDDLCPEPDPDAGVSDRIEVIVRYPYSQAPLVPRLGPEALFSFFLPDALIGRASVDLGIGLGLV